MELTLTENSFHGFLTLIHELTGITISRNRTSLVEGRLRKRVTALNLRSYEEYIRLVKEDLSEQVQFIDLVTTNETSFFRTPRIWDFIERWFLPDWYAKHPKQVFTAWSAAAASGEEAHSLAIICQAFKEANPGFLYQVLGTDISQEMIGLCQEGNYSGRSIEVFRKTRPNLFERYMQEHRSATFQVVCEIKGRLRFQRHNLFHALQSKDKFDLVLIRNVLIYFSRSDQENVLHLIAPRLSNQGALIIGESESLAHINTPYTAIEPLIYRIAAPLY